MNNKPIPLPYHLITDNRLNKISHPFYKRDLIRSEPPIINYQYQHQHQYNQYNSYQQHNYQPTPPPTYYNNYNYNDRYNNHVNYNQSYTPQHQQIYDQNEQYENYNYDEDYGYYDQDEEEDLYNQESEYFDEENPENNIQYVLSDEAIEMFAKTEMKRRMVNSDSNNFNSKSSKPKLVLDNIISPAEQSPIQRNSNDNN